MGNRQFNVKFPIKGQVIIAVILMLTCSFVATIVTYIGIAVSIRPSNHTENSVSALVRYVSAHGAAVLSPSEQPKLQSLVQGGGVQYLVMDPDAHPIYGTLVDATVTSRADMYRKLNTVSIQRQGFVFGSTMDKVIPVLSKDGSLIGAVYVKWYMFPGGVRSPNVWTRVIGVAFLLSPFVYMLLFTYIFARRVGKRINQPLQALIEATRRIQQRDLDFTIHYQGNNEIGKVLGAFEEMRKGLKDSLIVQWKLEEERREMLAAISHDIRTPITIIQGHAENLMDALNSVSEGEVAESPSLAHERLRRYMETIARNTNRVVRLMNDFHTVTDIDSPTMALKPQKIDVERYITSKYNEFQVVTAKHGISLLLEYIDRRDGPRDESVLGTAGMSNGSNHAGEHKGLVRMCIDTDRISQVIDNLMTNAIRFTPEGGQIVWHVAAHDDRLSVSIEDNGQGFQTTDVGRLFNKFYQSDESRSGQKGHFGLGLYIVKALVEKHGGAVSAEHTPGGGATFRFYIKSLDGKHPK